MRRLILLPLLLLPACQQDPPPGSDYYDRVIQPILTASCVNGTSPCHRADPDNPYAFAAGNLDLTSFENVHKRPDVLRPYGTYPVPLLLLKAVGPTDQLQIVYGDRFLDIEVPHAGGRLFDVGGPSFTTLLTWLEKGATRDGIAPPEVPVEGEGDCSDTIPDDFDPATVTSTTQWQMYETEFEAVQGVIDRKGCNAKNCHGAPQADFYITCGDEPGQKEFNFQQAWAFVNTPVDDSEILRRPLPPSLGGVTHAGGQHFLGKDDVDADYRAVKTWAEHVGPLDFGAGDPGKAFFADNVMPILLQRGCAAEGCHSPAAMNDFKLRAGTIGFFSAIALERNYDLAKREFLAFEVPDVRRGRILAKNLLPVYGGIDHRGGELLETAGSGGSDPSTCAPVYDPATASAYCTFVEWSRIERSALLAAGEVDALGAGSTIPIVYVERLASHVATPLEVDAYQADSDLLVVDATLDAAGTITGTGAPRSLLDGCPGAADRTQVDVRGPDVRNDGVTVAFSMRVGAGGAQRIYTVGLDGTGCAALTPADGAHHVDPAWSPDGEWIVYASTRAGGTSASGNPQTDLWRIRRDGGGDEQITFLSNSELGAAWMREGRITMTTEKSDPLGGGFYQLAGRRLNWDLTDYHPLLAQRAESPFADGQSGAATAPSVGFEQATEIREAFNGNFLMILSDRAARGGAGTLAIFNRSIGPNEVDRVLVDPGYMQSMIVVDPAATGRGDSDGAYRSPFPLLDGKVLVSYAPGTVNVDSTGSLAWDLVAIDPRTRARTLIVAGPRAEVDAVLALKYPARKLYYNRRQLVFGGLQGPDTAHAVVHFPDAPMLATLLDANLRRGRPVQSYRAATHVVFLDPASGSELGRAPINADGSCKAQVPASRPLLIGLANGPSRLFTMTEEHQYGPGENISMGVSERLFDNVCGGCHGSVSGREVDVAVRPDALTGASISIAASAPPTPIAP